MRRGAVTSQQHENVIFHLHEIASHLYSDKLAESQLLARCDSAGFIYLTSILKVLLLVIMSLSCVIEVMRNLAGFNLDSKMN